MTHLAFQPARSNRDPIVEAVGELVSIQQSGETLFISLPMFFPSGAAATVAVYKSRGGFIVSDYGFAYRELEAIGAERSFSKAATSASENEAVEKDRRRVFTNADPDDLSRAISDVATASWRIVTKVYDDRRSDEDEAALEDELTAKLVSLFGVERVKTGEKPRGLSGTEWGVSAIVEQDNARTIFHAVSNHPGSVYRANSAFHDLSGTKSPPRLVAVVRSLEALGSRLGVLSQAGKVIEESVSGDVFRKVAQ